MEITSIISMTAISITHMVTMSMSTQSRSQTQILPSVRQTTAAEAMKPDTFMVQVAAMKRYPTVIMSIISWMVIYITHTVITAMTTVSLSLRSPKAATRSHAA